MAVSLRHDLDRITDPRNLDGSVEEVFKMMMATECHRIEGPLASGEESVTAVVGFGGALSGACVLRSSSSSAQRIAERMTGMQFTEVDDTVKDAMGEICNILAGAWKSKLPELAANCGLSVPAVITGRDYRLHVQSPEFRLHHLYGFDNAGFEVTIVCDGLA